MSDNTNEHHFVLEFSGPNCVQNMKAQLNRLDLSNDMTRIRVEGDADAPIRLVQAQADVQETSQQTPTVDDGPTENGETPSTTEEVEEDLERSRDDEAEFPCPDCDAVFTTEKARDGHLYSPYTDCGDEDEGEDEDDALYVDGIRAENVPDLRPDTDRYWILNELVERDTWLHTPEIRQFISDEKGVNGDSISRQLSQLVEDGLVEKKPSSEDKRMNKYKPTGKGRVALRLAGIDRPISKDNVDDLDLDETQVDVEKAEAETATA